MPLTTKAIVTQNSDHEKGKHCKPNKKTFTSEQFFGLKFTDLVISVSHKVPGKDKNHQ